MCATLVLDPQRRKSAELKFVGSGDQLAAEGTAGGVEPAESVSGRPPGQRSAAIRPIGTFLRRRGPSLGRVYGCCVVSDLYRPQQRVANVPQHRPTGRCLPDSPASFTAAAGTTGRGTRSCRPRWSTSPAVSPALVRYDRDFSASHHPLSKCLRNLPRGRQARPSSAGTCLRLVLCLRESSRPNSLSSSRCSLCVAPRNASSSVAA